MTTTNIGGITRMPSHCTLTFKAGDTQLYKVSCDFNLSCKLLVFISLDHTCVLCILKFLRFMHSFSLVHLVLLYARFC